MRNVTTIATALLLSVCGSTMLAGTAIAAEKCEIDKPLTRAFVKTQGDVTSIVSGTAQWDELLRFAESLVPAKP